MSEKRDFITKTMINPGQIPNDVYLLRKSYRDAGGAFYNGSYYLFEWTGNIKKDEKGILSKSELTISGNATLTIGDGGGIYIENQNQAVKDLNAGVFFTESGTIDFANATGAIAMGENVLLKKMNIGYTQTCGMVLDKKTLSLGVDISGVYALTQLNIEGSLHSDIFAESFSDENNAPKNFGTYYTATDQKGETEKYVDSPAGLKFCNFYTTSDNNRILITGIRADIIQTELNMTGNISAASAGWTFNPFTKTSISANTIQSVGILANGTVDKESRVAVEGGTNGTIVMGGSIGTDGNKDTGGNGTWTGTVTAATGNMTFRTDIFDVTADYVRDADGDKYYDSKNGYVKKNYGSVSEYAEKNNGVDGKTPVNSYVYVDSVEYEKKTVKVLETEEKTVKIQKQITVAVPVEDTNGATRIRLYNADGSSAGSSYTAAELKAMGYAYYSIKSDKGDFYTGYALDVNSTAYHNGYLPEFIWILSGETASATGTTSATGAQYVQYEGNTITICIDTDEDLVRKVAYRNQDNLIIDNTKKDMSGDWYIVADQNVDPGALNCYYEETTTITVPVLTYKESTVLDSNNNQLYKVNPEDTYASGNENSSPSGVTYTPAVDENGNPLTDKNAKLYFWTWSYTEKEVDDETKQKNVGKNVAFVDPDFVVDSVKTFISDNHVLAQGLVAKNITLSNMETSGSINTLVSNIQLNGEYAIASFLDTKYASDADGTAHKEANKGYIDAEGDESEDKPGVHFSGNSATSIAIQSTNLTVEGTFRGTLNSAVSKLNATTEKNTFTYKLRIWNDTQYETQIGLDSGEAVKAKRFWPATGEEQKFIDKYMNPDTGKFVDPDTLCQIDVTLDESGNLVGSGYLLKPATDTQKEYYYDPVYKAYVDPTTGFVYSSADFRVENQLFYKLDLTSTAADKKILMHKAGEYVTLAKGQVYVADEEYDALHHSKTFTAADGDLTYLVDRTIAQSDQTNSKGMSAAAKGIETSNLTVNGNFFGDIFVSTDASIARDESGNIQISRADYTEEEKAAGHELNRVSSVTLMGIEAGSISTAGLFSPSIYVVNNSQTWNDAELKGYLEAGGITEVYDETAVFCVKTNTLTAEALAGDYYLSSRFLVATTSSGFPYAFLFNGGTAISVSTFDNGNDGSFDIIGNIYSGYDAILSLSSHSDYNLRISGEITAGYYVDSNGVEQEAPYLYAAFSDMVGTFKRGSKPRTDDRLELAAGARTRGSLDFQGGGNDTLIFDSNARSQGDILLGEGTLNLIFNLNDYVLDEDDRADVTRDGEAILTGTSNYNGISSASTVLLAITLNDVEMTVDGNGDPEAKTYTLIDNLRNDFADSLKTVDVKYDGLNVRTLKLDGTDIEAQIGYYDKTGAWVSVSNNLTGYEFRENNFTAKIGAGADLGYGNYIRVIDKNNNGQVIFQAHSEFVAYNAGFSMQYKLQIVVDVLPDQVALPGSESGETYYLSSFETGLENLREWYDRENKTLLLSWDDNSVDLSQTTYQLEYYFVTTDENGQTTKTNTIVREITKAVGESPRTSVTLTEIESNQTVVWRLRQALGIGNDITGDWVDMSLYRYERPSGLLQTANETGYKLEWKNELLSGSLDYYKLYYYIDGSDEPQSVDIDSSMDVKVAYQLNLAKGVTLSKWEIAIVKNSGGKEVALSETAQYQNLHIEKILYDLIAGLEANAGLNGSIVLSWNNVKAGEKDVSFVLQYRIKKVDGDSEWITETISPVDPEKASSVSFSVYPATALKSDEILEWKVSAYQKNGDDTSVSQITTASTTVVSPDGKVSYKTDSSIPEDSKKGQVTFTWVNSGTKDTTYLLEYEIDGKTMQVLVSSDSQNVVYDEKNNSVSYSFTPSSANALQWRVRRYVKDAEGNLSDVGEWMIYEYDNLTGLGQTSEVVHDSVLKKDTITTTLNFESNVPGSAYRLEYVIVKNNSNVGNPVSVDFAASSSKLFSYAVEGLNPDGTETVQWRVTTVTDGVYDKWTYQTPAMQNTFSDVVFCDKPENATSVNAGRNAVATLLWDAGMSVTNGLATYEVEYFQSSRYLSASEVSAYLDAHTDSLTGNITDDAYARLQVSNNQITITGLIDTQYVYWRVHAVDNTGTKSDWTVGDPFHVYLDDKAAPVFSKNPESSQDWVSTLKGDTRDKNLMDVTLSWDKATDDKAGVKCYTFQYTHTSGEAQQIHTVKYYFSTDNGTTWHEFSYDPETGARIDHIEGVDSYIIKIANLANGNYSWTLSATDYQGKVTEDKKTGSWTGDFLVPVFSDSEEKPAMNVTMAAYLSDTVSGGTATENKKATLAPILTWTPAIDDWKVVGDGTGSGVEEYLLVWKSNATDLEYSVTIKVEDLSLNENGTYTWQLMPEGGYDPEDERIKGLEQGDYTWKFYAVDYMGNQSEIANEAESSLAGEWVGDYAAPVFTQTTADVSGNTYYLNLINVNMTWDAATDTWFDPAEDPDTAGSGVQYYTLTYWKIDENDPDVHIGEVSKTIYTEYSYGWTPNFATSVVNADYGYSITATDYMGNTSSTSLTGTWKKNENPPEPPSGVASEVSFDHERMIGDLSWNPASGSDALYYSVKFYLIDANYDSETSPAVDEGILLHGFKGDVTPYESFFDFTETAENRWIMTFKEGSNNKEYLLSYDSATGNYTISFDIYQNGKTSPAVMTYSASQNKYFSTYNIVNSKNYEWRIQTFSVNGAGATPLADTWAGDDASPLFTNGSRSIASSVEYIRKKNSAGAKVTIAQVTVSVVGEATDFKYQGDYETPGCGVAYYTVSWSSSDSETWDYTKQFDAVTGGTASTTIDLSPSVSYRYQVTATDWIGKTYTVGSGDWQHYTSAAVSGTWAKDVLAPRFTETSEEISTASFTHTSDKMVNTLRWVMAEDDMLVTGDSAGSGTASYTINYSYAEGTSQVSKNITVIGEDFENFRDETVSGYVRNVSETGVITYTASKKEDDGNQWKVVYTCKYTDAGGVAQGGFYDMSFTMKNETYSWSISAVDFAGNATSTGLSGKWEKDAAAPVFLDSAVSTVGPSSKQSMSLSVSLTWSYSKDSVKGVIDPITATSEENDGSAIEYFTLRYKKTEDLAWTSLRIEAGKSASDGQFTITYKDGVYTAVSDTLSLDDYIWRLDATDYVGNTTDNLAATEKNSGSWLKIKSDIDAPVFLSGPVSLNNDYDPETKKATLTFNWVHASDKENTGHYVSGFNKYSLLCRKLDEEDSEWITLTSIDSQTVYTWSTTISSESEVKLADGYYQWIVTASDKAGNYTTKPDTPAMFIVDMTAPVFGSEDNNMLYSYNPDTKYFQMLFEWNNASDETSGLQKYVLTLTNSEHPEETLSIDISPNQTSVYLSDVFFSVDGTYSWSVTAYDNMNNTTVLKGSETIVVDTIPPQGKFTSLNVPAENIVAEFKKQSTYVHPVWTTVYSVTSASVTFNLENTFSGGTTSGGTTSGGTTSETAGITYQIRTYGIGANGEMVRMKTFSAETTTAVLQTALPPEPDDEDEKGTAGGTTSGGTTSGGTVSGGTMGTPGHREELSLVREDGLGYITNLYNDTVYWQVRAIDQAGNATIWYDGDSFKLLGTTETGATHLINDTTAPSVATFKDWKKAENKYAEDSPDHGYLTLSWEEAYDLFGIDRYDVNIYDQTGKTLLDTFESYHWYAFTDINQSQLENGNYMFNVVTCDCTGNKSAASEKIAFTYDTQRPVFNADAVQCDISPDRVDFSWEAMTDNLKTGTYGLEIIRESSGYMIVNETTIASLSYSWKPVAGNGTYIYNVYALDAHGNKSEAVANGRFSISSGTTESFKWNNSGIARTVGNGCNSNSFNILLNAASADGRGAAAAVTVTLSNVESDSISGGVDMVIRDQNGTEIETVTAVPGDGAWTGTFLWNESKGLNATYSIEVIAKNSLSATNYNLSVTKQDFTLSNTLDDTYGQARDNAKFQIKLAGNQTSGTIVSGEWVGFSDSVDFRQINPEMSGTYSFTVDSLTSTVKATLWRMTPSGIINEIAQSMSRGETAELDSVSLLKGETYYLSIEDPLAGEGRSTSYNVTYTKESPLSASDAASMSDPLAMTNDNLFDGFAASADTFQNGLGIA